MAIPSGVTTATVTFGKETDLLGENAAVTLRVQPSHRILWAASGEYINDFEVEVEAAEGVVGSFVVPHTDQAGFVDEAGNAITNWYYTVSGSVRRGRSAKAYRKVFQVTSDVTTMDLDTIPTNGNVVATGSAPVPAVSSVDGNTGAVSLSTTYVTFKNFDGTPVVGKNVVITLTADGTDIQDITVEAL